MHADQNKLQWGRNLIVAEGYGRPAKSPEGAPLQWGRNLIVAEGRSVEHGLDQRAASMGPQLDSCGRQVVHLGRYREFVASMGPQLDSCGRLGLPHLQGLEELASMGPQLDSCGRLALIKRYVRASGFNGAAT